MWTITLNGEQFEVLPARMKKLEPGVALCWRDHRRAYRFLCKDGNDYIMRNMRYPDNFEAFSESIVEREFHPIVRIGEGGN
jgi:hypothetical protein